MRQSRRKHEWWRNVIRQFHHECHNVATQVAPDASLRTASRARNPRRCWMNAVCAIEQNSPANFRTSTAPCPQVFAAQQSFDRIPLEIPMLLPITALYTGILGILAIILGAASGFMRARTGVSLGAADHIKFVAQLGLRRVGSEATT
jgi:hypothetical protein